MKVIKRNVNLFLFIDVSGITEDEMKAVESLGEMRIFFVCGMIMTNETFYNEDAEKIIELNLNIPIIAMTANIMSSNRELYGKIGIDDRVGKPFTSHELWNNLMKYLTPAVRETRASPQIDFEFAAALVTLGK